MIFSLPIANNTVLNQERLLTSLLHFFNTYNFLNCLKTIIMSVCSEVFLLQLIEMHLISLIKYGIELKIFQIYFKKKDSAVPIPI